MKRFSKVIMTITVATMTISGIGYSVNAKTDSYEILYQNDNILSNDRDLLKYASEDSSVATAYNLNSNQVYYEDGKLYEFECNNPKSITQKINTLKLSDDTIVENYIMDTVMSGNII